MNSLFFNSAEKLRSGWRFLFFIGLFWLCASVLFASLFGIAAFVPPLRNFLSGNGGFIVQNLITLLVAALAAVACQKLFEDLPARTLGWAFYAGWWRDAVLGLLYGILVLLTAIGSAAMLGAISFRPNDNFNSQAFAISLFSSGFIFFVGAAAEETLFRGYPLQTLARARFAWLAILLTSLPFALGHLQNPNVIPIFTFTNTALAGVWFALAYLKTRALWFPFTTHFVWNWVMAQFFGIPVSGITSLTPTPLLQSSTVDSLNWFSGGQYGIEGGAACTLALVVGILSVWLIPFPKPDPELYALNNPKDFAPPLSEQIDF